MPRCRLRLKRQIGSGNSAEQMNDISLWFRRASENRGSAVQKREHQGENSASRKTSCTNLVHLFLFCALFCRVANKPRHFSLDHLMLITNYGKPFMSSRGRQLAQASTTLYFEYALSNTAAIWCSVKKKRGDWMSSEPLRRGNLC